MAPSGQPMGPGQPAGVGPGQPAGAGPGQPAGAGSGQLGWLFLSCPGRLETAVAKVCCALEPPREHWLSQGPKSQRVDNSNGQAHSGTTASKPKLTHRTRKEGA